MAKKRVLTPGVVFPKDAVMLDLGHRYEQFKGKRYMLASNMNDGSPIVISCETGKGYTLIWEEIMNLAQAAGIDEPDAAESQS